VLGTIGYMSPEQVRGKAADARSDIFSFGAVLYEMLAGRRAFTGESAVETMHAIVRDDPPDLEHSARSLLSPALNGIVRHCLEKSPEQRFQSARDLAFALRSLSTTSEPSGFAVGPRSNGWRSNRWLASAMFAIAGIAVGALAGLRRAPAGESPVYQRLTFDRGMISRARFAPEGDTVVYSASWRGEPSEVFTTRIGSSESRSLGVQNAVFHAVSAGGELALGVHSDGLAWTPSTLARVSLGGGAPREVLDGITLADWSPTDSQLAVVRLFERGQRIELPIGHVLYQTAGNISHMRVSPNGEQVAFAEHPPDSPFGAGSLLLVDRVGTKKTLTSGWRDLWGLAWAPDGHEVWFTGAKQEQYKALYAVSIEGRDRLVTRMLGQVDLQDVSRDGRVLVAHVDFRDELMTRSPGTGERDLTWHGLSEVADISRDGDHVLFSELAPGGAGESSAYLRPTDGGPAVRLGEGSALSLSPDGKWALCLLSSATRLVALPTGAGEPRDLTRPGMNYIPWMAATGNRPYGTWFPDSRRVLYRAQEKNGPIQLYVQDRDGGEPRAMGAPGVEIALISPDGQTIATFTRDGRVTLQALDGGTPTTCCALTEREHLIRWGQDGRSFIGRRNDGMSSTLFTLELATGRRKQLWQLEPADRAGAAGPGPIAVTADGRAYAYSFDRVLGELYIVDGLK
jgi:eukaryotic-like serine/threonine-protein kinase